MDRIAEQAGVSKVTIYNHFVSKVQLFRATMDFYVAQVHASLPLITVEKGRSLRETLADYGSRLVSILSSDVALSLMKLIESERALGDATQIGVWESRLWPELGLFEEFLRLEDRTGRLRVENPELAARFFHSLILGSFVYPRVIRSASAGFLPPEEEDLMKTINAAVNVFVLGYSP
jgi:AcrR family transcriptional regulator